MARALRYSAVAAGLAFGVFSLAVARRGGGYSFGGSSAFAGAAELTAGYALFAVGIAAWIRPREARLGAILVAASLAWFMWEWNNQAAGSAGVFTVGLVGCAALALLGCDSSGSAGTRAARSMSRSANEPSAGSLTSSMQSSVHNASAVHISGQLSRNGVPFGRPFSNHDPIFYKLSVDSPGPVVKATRASRHRRH